MSDRKFEVLLNRNRNWLSRYGGFISLVLIVILVIGILKIEIPNYQSLNIDTNSEGLAYIKVEKENGSFQLKDIVKAEVTGEVPVSFEVVRIDTKVNQEVKHVFLKTNEKNITVTKELRVIIEKKSLLESLLGSFVK